MYSNKQPASGARKTVSKKKQLQDLERVAGSSSSRPSSRPSSRVGSRVGSRVNSDNEESDAELDAADDDEGLDDQNAELSWEAQLKDAIEELTEKRARWGKRKIFAPLLFFSPQFPPQFPVGREMPQQFSGG